MHDVRLELSRCTLRALRAEDAASIARHANDRNVWCNLRDAFPYPYRLDDAYAFIARQANATSPTHFAIDVDREACGGIGVHPGEDVERIGCELGYWLGAAFWNRGIMTEAVTAMPRHAHSALDMQRVFALPFATNAASHRVLEKCGYVREGVLRSAAIKDGRVTDMMMYAHVIA